MAHQPKKGWNKVDVALPEPSSDAGNHYDDDDTNTNIAVDLEDQSNLPGIFFGLEVITDYQIKGGVFKPSAASKPQTSNKSNKKTKKKAANKEEEEESSETTNKETTNEETNDDLDITIAQRIQQNWTSAAGVELPLALCQRMREFEHPTPIQRQVLQPAIFGRRNILGAAPTGSGKTLAFLLPILYDLLVSEETSIVALIITPTRELAKQIYQQAKALTDATVACFTGGLAKVKQERVLSQHPRIVTGTPGRLWDLMLNHDLNIDNSLKYLILDEADRLTHVRSFPELSRIFGKIKTAQQTLVFSATLMLPGMTDAHEILKLAHATGETKVIDLSTTTTTTNNNKVGQQKLPDGLKLYSIACTQKHKDSHLYSFLLTNNNERSCLVFCNSIAGVRRVGRTLQTLGMKVQQLHANMAQRARFQAVEFLSSGEKHVVVATDVAARGLDWTNVQSIVHYDAARTMDGFVHRAGRTARGVGDGAVGCSVSLVSSGEDKFYTMLTKKTGIKLEKLVLDSRILATAQERVNLATKIADFEDGDRKRVRDNQWFIDHAAEAGLELDDDLLDDGERSDQREQAKKSGISSAKRKLRRLLSEPVRVQRFGKFLSTNLSAKQVIVPEATPVPEPRTKQRRVRK